MSRILKTWFLAGVLYPVVDGLTVHYSRRAWIGSISCSVPLLVSPPALALQERNEALCGTGFFTNIWQSRCTELGDITDEGEAKGLSDSQEASVESLMSKLSASSPPSVLDSPTPTIDSASGNEGTFKESK